MPPQRTASADTARTIIFTTRRWPGHAEKRSDIVPKSNGGGRRVVVVLGVSFSPAFGGFLSASWVGGWSGIEKEACGKRFFPIHGAFSVPKIGAVFGADFVEQQSDTQRSVTFFCSQIWVVFLGSKIGPRTGSLFQNHWVHRVEIFAHMAGGGLWGACPSSRCTVLTFWVDAAL